MGKKRRATTFIISFFLITIFPVTSALAEFTVAGVTSIIPRNEHHKIAKPFQVHLECDLLPAESYNIEITLSEGVRLLQGELPWNGKMNQDSMYSYVINKNLLLQIDKPGIYEVTTTTNESNLRNPQYKIFFPGPSSMFIYAREDTMAFYWSRDEMMHRIRDSLIFTKEQYRIRHERVERIKRNGPISMAVTLNEFVSLYGDYLLDKDYGKEISKQYNTKEMNQISSRGLLFMLPKLDEVEKCLIYDFQPSNHILTDKDLNVLTTTMKRQITELFKFDQRLLQTDKDNIRDSLLQKRPTLLIDQTIERMTVIKWKPKSRNW